MVTHGPQDLEFDYDDEEDILYIALIGHAEDPAVTYETDSGFLVRLDPDTYDFIGAEVLGYKANWEGRDLIFEWEVRSGPLGLKRSKAEREIKIGQAVA